MRGETRKRKARSSSASAWWDGISCRVWGSVSPFPSTTAPCGCFRYRGRDYFSEKSCLVGRRGHQLRGLPVLAHRLHARAGLEQPDKRVDVVGLETSTDRARAKHV